MLLKIMRIEQGNNSTLSEIYLNNQFICYGLEDIPREKDTWKYFHSLGSLSFGF